MRLAPIRILSRKTAPLTEGTVRIELIPSHAWANRGASYMKVWIPLALPPRRPHQ